MFRLSAKNGATRYEGYKNIDITDYKHYRLPDNILSCLIMRIFSTFLLKKLNGTNSDKIDNSL